jgi:hypothetical protein
MITKKGEFYILELKVCSASAYTLKKKLILYAQKSKFSVYVYKHIHI